MAARACSSTSACRWSRRTAATSRAARRNVLHRSFWSLWLGYWDRNERLRVWAACAGVEPHFIHSGAHARPEDLKRLVAVVQLKTPAAWVHTDAFRRQVKG